MRNVEHDLVQVYADCRRRAVGMAAQIVGDREEAADVVQDAYLIAQARWHQFRGEGSVAGWFLRIVVNLALKRLRRRRLWDRVRHFWIEEPLPLRAWAEVSASNNELLAELGSALEVLPAKQRTAFLLRHAQDYAVDEVAALMNVSVPTVKTHLLRAAQRLRREMKGGLHDQTL